MTTRRENCRTCAPAALMKKTLSNLTLIELIIGVVALGVAGHFLVSGMQAAKHRERLRQITNAMEKWGSELSAEQRTKPAELVFTLVKVDPDLKNAKSKNGVTPLHPAAYHGNREIAQWLLDHGVDVNAKDIGDWTPLHLAAFHGRKEVAKLLLEKSANINAKDINGWTPLHGVARYGHTEIAELLLTKGADVNAKDKDGTTPLYWVAKGGRKEFAELLLTKGANVKAKNDGGVTPLHWAAAHGHTEIVEVLLAKGADVHAKENNGWTPLHSAAYYGRKEVAELLLAKGADINAKDNVGSTPLNQAIHPPPRQPPADQVSSPTNAFFDAYPDYKEIIELLLSKGADPNAKNKDNESPLDVVKARGDKTLADFLRVQGAKD